MSGAPENSEARLAPAVPEAEKGLGDSVGVRRRRPGVYDGANGREACAGRRHERFERDGEVVQQHRDDGHSGRRRNAQHSNAKVALESRKPKAIGAVAAFAGDAAVGPECEDHDVARSDICECRAPRRIVCVYRHAIVLHCHATNIDARDSGGESEKAGRSLCVVAAAVAIAEQRVEAAALRAEHGDASAHSKRQRMVVVAQEHEALRYALFGSGAARVRTNVGGAKREQSRGLRLERIELADAEAVSEDARGRGLDCGT